MSTYADLPYLENLSFPTVTYGRAQALRGPIAAAINPARSQPDATMQDIVVILEAALAHIRQTEVADEEIAIADPDVSVLDSLLGSTEALSNPS